MLWWIAGGIVVVPAVALVAVVAGLRRRLAELRRVSALAQDRAAQAQRLSARSADLGLMVANMSDISKKSRPPQVQDRRS